MSLDRRLIREVRTLDEYDLRRLMIFARGLLVQRRDLPLGPDEVIGTGPGKVGYRRQSVRCGKRGCLEVWCSGPGLAADFKRVTGRGSTAGEIAASDGVDERAAIGRLTDRFARALATMVNILDPDVIVMGGGLSNIDRFYSELPPLVEKYGFNLGAPPRIVKNMHGDSSGVRGAAWLWPEENV